MRSITIAALAIFCSTTLVAQTPVRWTATRDLRIGDVDDPEYAISYIRDLLIGKDGSMYALQDQTEVRVFGADGKARFKFGRRGDGPGEFTGAARIGWKGDTIWVYDSRLSRISLFLPDGKFINTLPARTPFVRADGSTVRASGLLADGSLVGGSGIPSQEVADGKITQASILRISRLAEGENARAVLDTIATYSVRNSVHLITDPENPRGVRAYWPQPFGDNPLVATGADGKAVYVVDRTAAKQSGSSSFTVTKRDLHGKVAYRKQFAYRPQKLQKALVDSIVQSRIETSTKSNNPGFAPALQPGNAERLVRKGMIVPEYHPPIQQVISGDDGTLWLRREGLGAANTSWQVLDASGNTIGMVELPTGLVVAAARRSNVWGQEFDDLQVSYLVRYRITPAPNPRR
jgi:hypothetical protein